MTTHDHTTKLLEASVALETGKKETTNLLNHEKEDLSGMIELIQGECEELQGLIKFDSEILSKTKIEVEKIIYRESIKRAQDKLDFFYAWRMVFLDAWTQVSKVK
jgi:hypothetical protein